MHDVQCGSIFFMICFLQNMHDHLQFISVKPLKHPNLSPDRSVVGYIMMSLFIIPPALKKLIGGILVSPCLRTQITLYEEDKNYPIWRRQERRSKHAVQLASWQLRSNSPKMSVRPSVRPSRSISCLHILSSNFRRCVVFKVCFKIQKFAILANSLNL